MTILIFLIDVHYIQRATKVPIFEHIPTLHLSTFRCTSINFEHFLCDNTVFCLQSHILHFSGTFKHSPEYTVPESHQRAGKAPAFEHFQHTTWLHKPPRSVAHPLTSNTFCSVLPLPVAACLTFCTFGVLLNTSGRRVIQSIAGYIQRAEESTHL